MKKTALVTGYAGFVGNHLIPALKDSHYTVVGTENLHDFLRHHAAAYREPFDVIVHLAANIVNVDQRARNGMDAFMDIDLDLTMCRFVERNPPREAFIAMSSCAVDYPADPYCVVKQTLEAFASTLTKQGIPVAILRPFSGYGPDQSLEYPFRAIFERALHRENPLTVWSDAVRDWVHIDDLVGAIMYAIDGGFPWGTPVEIGTGRGISFTQLAAQIAVATGYEPDVVVEKGKIGSSPYRISTSRLAHDCGWEPKITLADGIFRAVDYFRAQGRLR